jgi:hypothetical protein
MWIIQVYRMLYHLGVSYVVSLGVSYAELRYEISAGSQGSKSSEDPPPYDHPNPGVRPVKTSSDAESSLQGG